MPYRENTAPLPEKPKSGNEYTSVGEWSDDESEDIRLNGGGRGRGGDRGNSRPFRGRGGQARSNVNGFSYQRSQGYHTEDNRSHGQNFRGHSSRDQSHHLGDRSNDRGPHENGFDRGHEDRGGYVPRDFRGRGRGGIRGHSSYIDGHLDSRGYNNYNSRDGLEPLGHEPEVNILPREDFSSSHLNRNHEDDERRGANASYPSRDRYDGENRGTNFSNPSRNRYNDDNRGAGVHGGDRDQRRYANGSNSSSSYHNGGSTFSGRRGPAQGTYGNNESSSDRTSNSNQACFICKQEGHWSRECPEKGGEDHQGSCFVCKTSGHWARECPQRNLGTVRCYNCNEAGHVSRDCPLEAGASSNRLRGGGGGDDGRGGSSYMPKERTEEELFELHNTTGINFEKFKDIEPKVTGRSPPPLIQTFDKSGLHFKLLTAIEKNGYVNLTPVQKAAIPIILKHRDLMACAQTGSGKTAAFLLPILHRLLDVGVPPLSPGDLPQMPFAVIVTPTRELADQITNEAKKFSFKTGLKAIAIYGGTSKEGMRNRIKSAAHIVVATPGRLLDYLEEGAISFKKVQFFVLDEADRMLESGFMPDIEMMENHMTMPKKRDRQTLMFSATFPEEIQNAAKRFLNDYLYVQVGLLGSASGDVRQTFIQVKNFDKREQLLSILMDFDKIEKTLIFVAQKIHADFLATFLSNKLGNVKATSVHGDRLQAQREEAVFDFKRGEMPILVATAVMARGLDIPEVSHVINYDLPDTIDEYVHRIGRTGRVGHVGRATSFYDEERDRALAADLVRNLAEVQQEVPAWLQAEARRSYPTASRGNHARRNQDIRRPQRENEKSVEAQHHASVPVFEDEDEAWD